jgi:hypothetical protein
MELRVLGSGVVGLEVLLVLGIAVASASKVLFAQI